MVVLAGAWGTSYAAGRLGLPVSRGLVVQGVWHAESWAAFPWLDCVGMLVFMVALPVGWAALRGRQLVCDALRQPAKTAAYAAAALLLAAAIWAARHYGGVPPAGAAYRGSLLMLCVYWLVVDVSEEWAFRGVLQRGVAARFGKIVGLTVATAAFVFWHGVPANATVLLVRAGAGLVLGLLYQFSGSLLPPIICHWALNVALVT